MGLAGPSPRVNGGNTSTQLGTFSTSIVTTGSSWSVELMFLHSASQGVMGSCILSNGTNYGVTYETTGTKLSVDGTGNTAETTALTAGVWAHEVLTWDGTTSTIFRNGLPNGSGTGAGATAPATFDSWLGASTALNQTPSSIAWFRVWSRIVGQAEALDLFANPFAMVIVPVEDARTFSILSGRPFVVTSPVLSASILASIPRVVAPFPPRALLGASVSNIVSGSVSFISNSALAESAQVVAPATVQANSALAESAQVVAPTTVQANSALVESAAQVLAPATVQSNSLLAEAVQIIAPATIQANSLLAESAQIVETTADAALVQANSALVLPTAQIVDPSIPFVSNSLLAVTGGLAGQGGGTLISNSLLAEGAQISAAAARVQTNSVLGEVTQVVAPAIMQSNCLLSVTGGLAGGGTVQGGGTFASSSVLVQQSAQLRTQGTIQSNSVLSVTPQGTGPTRIAVSDAPLWATALSDAPLWATTLSDAPLAATGLGDAATSATSVADAALAQTVRSEERRVGKEG